MLGRIFENLLAEINPETAFKLYLVSASQVNSILSDRKNLEEACVSFINSALQLYQDRNFEENIKYNMFLEICGYLINFLRVFELLKDLKLLLKNSC